MTEKEHQQGVDFAQLNQEDYRDLSAPGRRRAREGALLMLYQLDFGGNDPEIAAQTLNDIKVKGGQAQFAKDLVQAAREHRAAADEVIRGQAQEWQFERLFSIDKAILRLALAELERSETPAEIVINEAVELAKKFGNEASPKFINAVLDTVCQQKRGEDKGE